MRFHKKAFMDKSHFYVHVNRYHKNKELQRKVHLSPRNLENKRKSFSEVQDNNSSCKKLPKTQLDNRCYEKGVHENTIQPNNYTETLSNFDIGVLGDDVIVDPCEPCESSASNILNHFSEENQGSNNIDISNDIEIGGGDELGIHPGTSSSFIFKRMFSEKCIPKRKVEHSTTNERLNAE